VSFALQYNPWPNRERVTNRVRLRVSQPLDSAMQYEGTSKTGKVPSIRLLTVEMLSTRENRPTKEWK